MSTSEPGEARGAREGRSGRLQRPPSARYAEPDRPEPADGRRLLLKALAQAVLAAAVGAGLLFVVGAIVASTAGLLFVAGVTGAAVGLLVSRGNVATAGGRPALTRGTATGLAVGLAIGAVIVAAVATWLYARGEGGTLPLVDYLLQTFGPFVPGELVFATLGALWGASSGPIRRA